MKTTKEQRASWRAMASDPFFDIQPSVRAGLANVLDDLETVEARLKLADRTIELANRWAYARTDHNENGCLCNGECKLPGATERAVKALLAYPLDATGTGEEHDSEHESDMKTTKPTPDTDGGA